MGGFQTCRDPVLEADVDGLAFQISTSQNEVISIPEGIRDRPGAAGRPEDDRIRSRPAALSPLLIIRDCAVFVTLHALVG